jgi:P4 family phage/plasmid primase-like protien
MNKAFFKHYMSAEPANAKEKYIFITDNEEIAQSIILAGFKSVFLANEDSEYQYSIDTFLNYLDEIAYKGKCRTDYTYIPACSTKKANDTLEEYFKAEYLKTHQGWRLFKNKEYLSNYDKEDELKKTLEEYVKRFEGDSDDSQPDLMQFHLTNDKGVAVGVFDAAIENYIINNQKLFIYGGIPFLYSDGCFFPDWTRAELSTSIREKIYERLIKSTTIDRVYRLFLTDARIQKSFDEINTYPAEWICFRNGMYDPINKKMLPHDDKYCCINQVPHEYHPETLPKAGATIEEYLNFICDGKQDTREMLLQYMGYSLTRDTRQQKFLILTGEGGSGKSTLIKCFEMLAGQRNISNVSLTDLQQRFSSIELMGMLVNSCADLEIGALTDTSMIKKLVGEDSIKGERKGKDLVFFKNYAKLIFSTNELPVIKSEKTNAFYRRLIVFPMNKVPERKDPDLFQKLEAEKNYLLMLAVQALERMYQQKNITVAAASEHEIERLRADSDTVEGFILEECEKVDGCREERTELYKRYSAYCEESERQALTKNNFYKSLRLKGYSEITSSGKRYFLGLKSALENCTNDGFIQVTQEQLEDLPFE